MSSPLEPIPTPYHQKVADFKQRRLPLLVWLVCAAVCTYMLGNRAARFESIGLAQSLEYEVSADSTGRLETVVVQLYDHVEVGDVVAKLNGEQLEAGLEAANAMIRKLGADLDAARVELLASRSQDHSDWTSDLRRFQINEEQRRLDLLELRVTIESDQIEAERLALELRRAEQLLAAGMIGDLEFDEKRLFHAEIRQRVEDNTILLAQTEDEFHTAQARRTSFENSLPKAPDEEPLLRPLKEAIEVEISRMRMLELQRESLLLRSPVSGQVSSIVCRKGQSVLAGEPILTVAENSVSEIVAYLNESDSRRVMENDQVLVSSFSRPDSAVESFVMRVGPTVEQIPQRLWRSAATPDYGRAVVIAGIPRLQLRPGELLSIRFATDSIQGRTRSQP